jgi:hypothetical protein
MSAEPVSPERYRACEVSRHPAGENVELVYAPLTRAAQVLPSVAVALLQGCRTFATLEEHAGRLCRAYNLGAQAEAVRQQLAALVRAGLLVSHADLAARCRTAGPAEAPLRIAALGVPTRGRPDGLRRCLLSFAENARRFGRAP